MTFFLHYIFLLCVYSLADTEFNLLLSLVKLSQVQIFEKSAM